MKRVIKAFVNRPKWRRWTRFVAVATAILFAAVGQAQAQFSIQIGGSEADFKARLAQQGFDRIDTVKIGLSSSKFNACKGNKRYRIKFEWTGLVETKEIGNCRVAVSEKQVRQTLRERGYKRVIIEDQSGKYLAIGCRDTERYRVEVTHFGDIKRERRIGRCRDELSPTDITAALEAEGYNRVIFTDRQLPRYVAEACLDREKLELTLNRFGEIAGRKSIGQCRDRVQPAELTEILEEKGLTRIVVLDDSLPRYRAEACRKGERVEVTVNRWGDIRDEVRIGRCRIDFTADELAAAIASQGYTNVSVSPERRGFVARGCLDNRYLEIAINRFGEVTSRRERGSCDAPRISDLAETLRGRGLRRLDFYVEACRDGSRVRIHFDEFANRIDRQVLGAC